LTSNNLSSGINVSERRSYRYTKTTRRAKIHNLHVYILCAVKFASKWGSSCHNEKRQLLPHFRGGCQKKSLTSNYLSAPGWPALLTQLHSFRLPSPHISLKDSPSSISTMDSSKQSLKRQSSFSFSSSKPAKQAKSEPSRTPLQPISSNLQITTNTAKKNVGGASKLSWFNPLATRSDLTACRQNLFDKIKNTTTNSFSCVSVNSFKEDTRPVMDKQYNSILLSKLASVDTITRYSPYAISMMEAQKLLPTYDPPALPAKFRQVTKRSGKETEKEATWVISHLCHNKICINADHLRWEPS